MHILYIDIFIIYLATSSFSLTLETSKCTRVSICVRCFFLSLNGRFADQRIPLNFDYRQRERWKGGTQLTRYVRVCIAMDDRANED